MADRRPDAQTPRHTHTQSGIHFLHVPTRGATQSGVHAPRPALAPWTHAGGTPCTRDALALPLQHTLTGSTQPSIPIPGSFPFGDMPVDASAGKNLVALLHVTGKPLLVERNGVVFPADTDSPRSLYLPKLLLEKLRQPRIHASS